MTNRCKASRRSFIKSVGLAVPLMLGVLPAESQTEPVPERVAELHVALRGNDANRGTRTAPLRTIQRAAELAQPGDVITVHAGIYRERVSPPRGGTSDAKRIVYQAAQGEVVVISGAEAVKNWVKAKGDVWQTTLPNSFFGRFNPYSDLLHGDWFNALGREHHTGAVYLNGKCLSEAASLQEVMKSSAGEALWYGQVGGENTILSAQFPGVDPNRQRVEINVRQSVFYPEKTGINYITVRGFILEDAATPWAPPTAEQIGVIGPHWSKGWIIENNVVRNSICSGISLGKYGDQWDNTSANTAEGFVKTVERALAAGWSKGNIGQHVVRNNLIHDCGQAGIVGALGPAFSTVTGNTIHDIHVKQTFAGAEIAGIKFHGAVDVQIAHNNIYHTPLGLWLDWMAQGTHISRNLFHDNSVDVFVEVDHGPFLFDNNFLLSSVSLRDNSQGGAYAHNLFAGAVKALPFDSRQTPFLKAHSTAIAGFHDNPRGDDRYYNNVFVQRADLSTYDNAPLPMWMDSNVCLNGAKPSKFDKRLVVEPDFDPQLKLVSKPGGLYLEMRFDQHWTDEPEREMVTSALLGRAVIPNLPYEQPDGSAIRIDTDYFGKKRNRSNPTAGPFEQPGQGDLKLKVWS
ncbi:MAG: right-handed parallel beta-helix repeat-containing protein [Terriglobia bacterium]|nr:right-handed parallel beta-helix repeat-containing protein [Terriglobia bacterium]